MNVTASMGWDAGWADAFDRFASTGSRPARVVAVHRETAIVRKADGVSGSSDRPAIVSGRFRFDALAPSDYPAVGDWVTLASDAATTRADEPAIITAVLPRRSAFVRSAADASRRSAGNLVDGRCWPPTSTWRSWSPGSTTTSISAASSATSRSPGRAACGRSSS